MLNGIVTREVPPLAFKPAEAARRVGMSERFLIELRDRGQLPFIRLGRAILFLDSDLQELLRKHRITATVA